MQSNNKIVKLIKRHEGSTKNHDASDWDMHLKGKKFNKTRRGCGGYKGAFFNLPEKDLGVLLGSKEL